MQIEIDGKLFDGFINTEEFSAWMSNRNNAKMLLEKIYESRVDNRGDLLRNAIQKDKRNLPKSISYLWLLRRAVLDNDITIVNAIISNINYEPRFLAIVMDADSTREQIFAHDVFINSTTYAYAAVLDYIRQRDIELFRAYMRYRILAYKSENELKINLIISMDLSLLDRIADLPKMKSIIPSLIEAMSDDVMKSEHVRSISDAAGRFPNRDQLGQLIIESEKAHWPNNVGRRDALGVIEGSKIGWSYTQKQELANNKVEKKLHDVFLKLSGSVYTKELITSIIEEMESYRVVKTVYVGTNTIVDQYTTVARNLIRHVLKIERKKYILRKPEENEEDASLD